MEGSNPVGRLYRVDVRRDGKADLFGDRRLVKTTDCFVGKPAATPNADQMEDIGLEDCYGRPSGSS